MWVRFSTNFNSTFIPKCCFGALWFQTLKCMDHSYPIHSVFCLRFLKPSHGTTLQTSPTSPRGKQGSSMALPSAWNVFHLLVFWDASNELAKLNSDITTSWKPYLLARPQQGYVFLILLSVIFGLDICLSCVF